MIAKFDAIDYIDKLWVKYYSIEDAFKEILKFFNKHREYTHLILNTDDSAPDYNHIAMIIADVEKYNFPVISGCCTIDALYGDMFLNLTIDPLVNPKLKLIKKIVQPLFIEDWNPPIDDNAMRTESRGMFKLLPNEFKNLKGIIKVWFEGHALTCIQRNVLEKVGLLWNQESSLPKWTKVGDLMFALQCQMNGIQQYTDLRCYYLHRKYHQSIPPYNILVGQCKSFIKFVKATKNIPNMPAAEVIDPIPQEYQDLMRYYYEDGPTPSLINKKIVLFTPFCNEEHSIPQYIDSLLKIDYPKELIDIVWIENSSEDSTWRMLREMKEKIEHLYHSLTLVRMDGGFTLPKVQIGDFQGAGGKMSGDTPWELRKTRSNLLVSIWNYAMTFFDETKDYFMFYFADVVVQPNIIKKYIEDLENHPDCGWIGGVMHKRFPHHYRQVDGNPYTDGIAAPFFQIQDNEPMPKYHPKILGGYRLSQMQSEFARPVTLMAWKFHFSKYLQRFPNKFPYRYGFYTAVEQEIIDLQNVLDGVHEAAITYHVWMLRSEIIKLGIKFYSAPYETAFAFEHDLHQHGYKVYVDTNIYLKHISIDGKIWRNGIFENQSTSSIPKPLPLDVIVKILSKKKPRNVLEDEYFMFIKSSYTDQIKAQHKLEEKENPNEGKQRPVPKEKAKEKPNENKQEEQPKIIEETIEQKPSEVVQELHPKIVKKKEEPESKIEEKPKEKPNEGKQGPHP